MINKLKRLSDIQYMNARLKDKANDIKYVISGIKKYSGDSLYRINNLERGITDHRSFNTTSDEQIIDRLIIFFKEMKEAQRNVKAYYRPAEGWQRWIDFPFKDLVEALNKKDGSALSSYLQNFMRNYAICYDYISPWHKIPYLFKSKIGKYLYMNIIFDTYYFWKYITGIAEPIPALSHSLVGNPYGYYLGNVLVTTASCFLQRLTCHLRDLIADIKRPGIMEIGGGYGQLAVYMLREMEKYTYINFDLPEVAVIFSYYMLKNFPQKKFLLFGEAALTSNSLSDYDVIIMPNYKIEDLDDGSIDLVINKNSLGEMHRDTVIKYIGDISRICRRYFFHMNHEYYPDYSGLPAHQYPIQDNIFLRIYRTPYMDPFNFTRNVKGMKDDIFLYLYEKSSTSSKFISRRPPANE
jgi:hypothetical protein